MSLATRCPACGTIFRVVQDQLKVSEGWVRCGQCHEVFHGIEALFDLESDPAFAARRAARQAQGERAAFASAPTVRAPLASMPAAPPMSAPDATLAASDRASFDEGITPPPAPAAIMAGPAIEAALVAPGALAKPQASDADEAAASDVAPAEPSPAFAPEDEPPPRPDDAPAEPSGLDPVGLAHVDIALDDDQRALSELLPETRELDDAETAAFARAAEFASPQQLEDTHEPMPSLPADAQALDLPDDDDDDDDEDQDDDDDAGPLTLASMLPESVATWPPRRRRKRAAAPAPSAAAAADGTALEVAHPRFVREARREARWSRPWVRAALAVSLVVLVGASAAQMAWPWRDTIASRWPATAPVLEMGCEVLDCRIEAPRSIASLTLDGSSLTRTDEDHVLLFSADLRNRSDHAVRMPSFDLSFTDLNGQVVARKVLAPSQIGIHQGALGPEAELHVHARLHVASLEASGFQAEMFYP